MKYELPPGIERPVDITAAAGSPLDHLRGMSVAMRLDDMAKKLRNDKYVFPDMALAGTTTLFYSKPNGGKTAFALRFLIDGIKAKQIDPAGVFYLNADDNYEGLYFKGKIAKEYGFSMISPAENKMTPDEVLRVIMGVADSENAEGLIFVFDTLKKFVDMMNKRAQATLYEALRRLNAVGATVILLGHVNKKIEDDGTLTYEGTADTLNDIDVAYAMYSLSAREDVNQVVEFRNTKDRGRVAAKVTYSYRKERDSTYMDLLNSIRRMDSTEAGKASEQARQIALRAQYESVLLFLKEALTVPLNESEILAAHKSGEWEIAAEFSANELKKGLRALAGVELDMVRDKQRKNAKFYSLKGSAAATYKGVRDGGI